MSAHSITSRGLAGRKIPQGTLTPIGALLFSGSEPGAWYDPSDLSTLFQDSAGTTPVTAVEQPVGRMLDKSKGLVLGPELATSAWLNNFSTTFDTFTTTGGGGFTATVASAKAPRTRVPLSPTAGKTYKVTFDMVSTGVSTLGVFLDDGAYSGTVITGITSNSDGTKHATVVATSPSVGLMIIPTFSGAGSIAVSNVSVKELPGNHATQATTTKRGVVSRRVNLLPQSHNIGGGLWVLALGNLSSSNGTGALPTVYADYGTVDGELANRIVLNLNGGTTSSDRAGMFLPTTAIGQFSICVKSLDATPTETLVDKLNFNTSGGKIVTPLADGSVLVTGTVALGAQIRLQLIGWGGLDSADFLIGKASVILGIDAHLPYQWVNTATDYDDDSDKFPTYIRFDGVDDAYQTNSIDFTGTDKMTVWAGVANIIGSGPQAIIELSNIPATPTSGSFWINANGMFPNDLWCGLSSPGSIRTGYSFPRAGSVLNVSYDFSGTARATEVFPRLNGAVPILTGGLTPDAGNGPFGNSPLYIGARSGTSMFFNGRLYGLIVAGANYTQSQIEATELYIKQKMRMP